MNNIFLIELKKLEIAKLNSIPLIRINAVIKDRFLGTLEKSFLFSKFMIEKNKSYIQDINGYIYSIVKNESTSLIHDFIKKNNFEILPYIDYSNVRIEQLGYSEAKESTILKNEYNNIIEIKIRAVESEIDLSKTHILQSRNSVFKDVDGYETIEDLFSKTEVDNRLNIYSKNNFVDFKNNLLYVEEHTAYSNASEIEKLFINDENKSILFQGTDFISSVKDQLIDLYIVNDDDIKKIHSFFKNSIDYQYIEYEMVNNTFQISAIYQKNDKFMWCKIPKEYFDHFHIEL